MKKNIKIFIVVYMLLCSIDLQAIIRDGNKPCEDIYEIYPIVDTVELDDGYRNLLGRYISLSMMCYDCSSLNADSLEMLFIRQSFEQSLLYLCTPDNYSHSNIYYEDDSRWKETLPYLIRNCSNKIVQYKNANKLLRQGIDIGLIALWDSCDINKLPYYPMYKRELVAKRNYYLLGDLAIIAHNAKNKKECEELLHMIRKYNKPFWQFLKKYINQNEYLSFYSYYSILYEEYFNKITP